MTTTSNETETTPSPLTVRISNNEPSQLYIKDVRHWAESYLLAFQASPNPDLDAASAMTPTSVITWPFADAILSDTKHIEKYQMRTHKLIWKYWGLNNKQNFGPRNDCSPAEGRFWLFCKNERRCKYGNEYVRRHIYARAAVVFRLYALQKAEWCVERMVKENGLVKEKDIAEWTLDDLNESGILKDTLFEKVRDTGAFTAPKAGFGPLYERPIAYVAWCIRQTGCSDEQASEMVRRLHDDEGFKFEA